MARVRSSMWKATSSYGPLELEIPIDVLEQPGETIHQPAAKRAIADLQEGHPDESRGWLVDAKDSKGVLIKEKYPGRFSEMVEREAGRLGVQFQVGGKCLAVNYALKGATRPMDCVERRDVVRHHRHKSLQSLLQRWKCLHSLIAFQEFKGCWILRAHFCQVIGLGLAKVKAAATKLNVDEKWLATALAVRYLVKQLGHESDTWELVVEKARAWLEAQPEGGDEKSEVWTVEKLK
ncbi:von Willebrand domain containing protein [Venturia nashicola]|nr:von Willebrand domain containing protein [Venturia nashicola]